MISIIIIIRAIVAITTIRIILILIMIKIDRSCFYFVKDVFKESRYKNREKKGFHLANTFR